MNTPESLTACYDDEHGEPCVPLAIAIKIERERDEARGQRDRLAEALKQCCEDSVELLAERDWWQNETRFDYQKRYCVTRDNIDRADAALQSLTPNETISQ